MLCLSISLFGVSEEGENGLNMCTNKTYLAVNTHITFSVVLLNSLPFFRAHPGEMSYVAGAYMYRNYYSTTECAVCTQRYNYVWYDTLTLDLCVLTDTNSYYNR